MLFIPASEKYRERIVRFLEENHLPSQDLPSSLEDFYIVSEEEKLVGMIGMERYGKYGLLRSLAVHPDFRNRHVAKRLVKMIEDQAESYGIDQLFLFTETADNYFAKKDFVSIMRDEVPS